MARLIPTSCVAAAVLVPLLAGGCVQQDKYDQLLQVKRSLQEQLLEVTNERDSYNAQLKNRNQQLASAQTDILKMQEEYEMLGGKVDELGDNNRNLARMVSEMAIGPLPADIQEKLAALASQYPDQITFDSGSGMLRFNSDLTFNSGKDVVKPEAADTLAKLATILDSDSASSFELVIVGHTDDVQPKYSKNQHPTNRHLAVHRAIAVCNELVQAGVANDRVQVAGWGEYRPLVPNEDGGTAMNRRVEIYLAATNNTNTMPMTESTTTTATVDTDEPMK
ncbi:MAG: OmpA family protein [Phycisphaerales bacterium]|nr:OmpA family protein [Phycisphaerales bacterium]